jgi:predicted HAD superfamily Cof-like phosphohydrolase
MDKSQKQVKEFHQAFDVPTPTRPEKMPDERTRLRARLVAEEFFEFLHSLYGEENGMVFAAKKMTDQAINTQPIKFDMVEFCDSLSDMIYVINGSALEAGVDLEPISDEVHRSNMSKVGGTKRPDGKILKNPNWSPPNIIDILKSHGFETE